jgi:hypothetical protein
MAAILIQTTMHNLAIHLQVFHCKELIDQKRTRAANERLADDLAAGGFAPSTSKKAKRGSGSDRPAICSMLCTPPLSLDHS